MDTEIITDIAERIETLQSEQALTDRAVAAALKYFIRTGEFPDGVPDEPDVEDTLLEATWLLFVAAPAIEPSYLIVSSMHLNMVLTGDRPLATLFDELNTAADAPGDDDADLPDWFDDYRRIGQRPLPEQPRGDELRQRIEKTRTILQEHHEDVLQYSRSLLDSIATDIDHRVEEGSLSPLGDFPYGDLDAPDDPNALVERGIMRASLEDLSGACEDFDRALKLDDEHLLARLNRALARHSMGEVEAAIEDYDRALAMVDDDPEIWTNRGIARFSARDLDGALHDLNRALELDDDMAAAYLHRGNVRRVRKEVGHALSDYDRALKAHPEFVDAYSARGFLHLQVGDAKKARADFDRAIELRPSDPALYYNRAHAHLLSEHVDDALADYDRALELDPEDVEALANRGAAKMMNGDLDGAIEDWETAIAIDPYYPTPYLKRASMWIATEQPEEAARDLQIALDNAPHDWPHRQDVQKTLDELLDELGFDHPE